MGRKKKTTIATCVALDRRSIEYVNAFAEENRITKSAAVERIMQEFLEMRSESFVDEVIKIAMEGKNNEHQ